MEAQILLKDPEIFPSDKVLKNVLGDTVYNVLESFITIITSEGYNLIPEWRYYNDGKVWLCKVVYKKKTILWLSIWDGFFKVSFNFPERYSEQIRSLDISEAIKEKFLQAKPVGRSLSLIVDVTDEQQIKDVLVVVDFKKNLK